MAEIRLLGNRGKGDLTRRNATHRKAPAGELEVLDIGLQHVAGDPLRLVDDLHDRVVDGNAADRHGSRVIGATAEWHLGRVVLDDLDILDREAELLGHYLGERSEVALAVR